MENQSADSVNPSADSQEETTKSVTYTNLIAEIPPSVAHKDERSYGHPDPTPLWKIVLEIGAVAVGIIVAWIYYGQLEVMRGQLGEIIRQYPEIKKGADASVVASQAAIASLNETTMQMQREYRAWVKVTATNASFTYGDPMVIPIHIENVGKTPAKNVSGDIALYLMEHQENPKFLYGEEGRKQKYPSYHFSTHMITQNASMDNPLVMTQHGKTGRANLTWSKELQARLENRELWIVVYGRFEYGDIFGTRHWQTFCYMPRSPQITIGGTGKVGEHVGNDVCEAYEDTDSN